MGKTRDSVVNLALSWVGLKESDGSYKKILNIYNSQKKLPRSVKMEVGMAWCATTWSALAIHLGLEDIMPVECSCGQLVNQAKSMGIWQENDAYMPEVGDAVLFDWQDTGKGDNTGWPDHIGVVVYADPNTGKFITVEGNYSKSVKKRTMQKNQKQIRGFITPRYEDVDPVKTLKEVAVDVIHGKYGNAPVRQKNLAEDPTVAYSYKDVQAEVNRLLAQK